MDFRLVCGRRLLELSKLEEHRLHAYENAKIYKDKVKYWHDNHLIPKQCEVGQKCSYAIYALGCFPKNSNQCDRDHLKSLKCFLMGLLKWLIQEKNSSRSMGND